MKLIRRTAIALCLTFGMSCATAGLAAEEIGWGDLEPAGSEEFVDPFQDLTDQQLFSLSTVAQLRELQEIQEQLSLLDQEDMDTELRRLDEWDIDVDEMLKKRDEAIAYYTDLASEVNPELNGKEIRMPGYLLPLEYEDERVIEFLLVPYVGACIHTPPPPPNQIVKVSSEGGFVSSDLFTPVWVEGTMKTEALEADLTFVDGSADISVGYTMEADFIELYDE